jgi:hypothetical protein
MVVVEIAVVVMVVAVMIIHVVVAVTANVRSMVEEEEEVAVVDAVVTADIRIAAVTRVAIVEAAAGGIIEGPSTVTETIAGAVAAGGNKLSWASTYRRWLIAWSALDAKSSGNSASHDRVTWPFFNPARP